MPGGWYGSLLRTRSAQEEWVAMQDHLNLLKLVNADIFVFADVSGSIQGDQTKKLSTQDRLWKMMNLLNIVKKLMKSLIVYMMKVFQCLTMNIWVQLFKQNMM